MEFKLEDAGTKKFEIFIAYHQDFSYHAKKFADRLKQQTTWRVFLSSGDSDLNDDEALDALQHTRNVVLLISHGFQSSARCVTIFEWARHFNRHISGIQVKDNDFNKKQEDFLMLLISSYCRFSLRNRMISR